LGGWSNPNRLLHPLSSHEKTIETRRIQPGEQKNHRPPDPGVATQEIIIDPSKVTCPKNIQGIRDSKNKKGKL